MHDFGAQAGWTSESSIDVTPGGYRDTPFRVESDWSAASYWYQMTALATGSPEVELLGLFANSAQAVRKVTAVVPNSLPDWVYRQNILHKA